MKLRRQVIVKSLIFRAHKTDAHKKKIQISTSGLALKTRLFANTTSPARAKCALIPWIEEAKNALTTEFAEITE